jgi:hypothetical protein
LLFPKNIPAELILQQKLLVKVQLFIINLGLFGIVNFLLPLHRLLVRLIEHALSDRDDILIIIGLLFLKNNRGLFLNFFFLTREWIKLTELIFGCLQRGILEGKEVGIFQTKEMADF